MIYATGITTALILYIISVCYLDDRYEVEVNSQLQHLSLRMKGNQIMAAGYLLSALAAGYLFPHYGYGALATVKALYLIAFSMVIAYVDQKEQIIPNKLLIVLLWSALLFRIIEIAMQPAALIQIAGSAAMGGVLGGGIFLAAHLLYRSGIGAGDVKLFGVIGLYVGNYTVFGIMLISLLLVAVAGVGAMICKKGGLKQEVPFGPYVAAGVILAMLLGF